MNHLLLFALAVMAFSSKAQVLQIHYNPRHTLDPGHNASNFPTIYFEYFKSKDTLGSFFINSEADLNGADHNSCPF